MRNTRYEENAIEGVAIQASVEGELVGATAVARGRFGDEGTGGEVKALRGGKAAAGTGMG